MQFHISETLFINLTPAKLLFLIVYFYFLFGYDILLMKKSKRNGFIIMNLFVIEKAIGKHIPICVRPASETDLDSTKTWQTNWHSSYAKTLPNIVALHRTDNDELLGLMSYISDGRMLAVEIIYLENAAHSNANLLHEAGRQKKYDGIAKALFAYAASISIEDGYGGVLVFKAKTSELVEYYIREFGACHAGSYDPFRLVIWEDAAQSIIEFYK